MSTEPGAVHLEILEELCRYGLVASSISEAALFQAINRDLAKRPTLLIDEVDAIFGRSSEQTEGLRGVINSGNRRSGRALRGSKDGTPQGFSTFGCKVLAGINSGTLPDTVQDRSIAIVLQRKRGDVRLERHAVHRLGTEYAAIRKRIDAWAKTHAPALTDAYPELPEGLSDRAMDGWEPLLAIADLAGPDIATAAREAALALRDDFGAGAGSPSERLLGAMREAMDGRAFIGTGELLDYLNGMEEATWHLLNRGQGIAPHNLSALLKPYNITSRRGRLQGGTQVRGYYASDLQEAWDRYLPPDPRAWAEKASQRHTEPDDDDEASFDSLLDD